MMRSMTAGLGVLTILAIAGTMTPAGQAMLGMRPSQTQTPVSVISDPGDASANVLPAAPAAPRPAVATPAPAAAPRPAPAAPARVAAPAAAPQASAPRPAAVPQAGSPLPGTPGVTPASSIANILLNLPQVLQQTQVRPDGSQPVVVKPGPGQGHGPKGKKQGDDETIEH